MLHYLDKVFADGFDSPEVKVPPDWNVKPQEASFQEEGGELREIWNGVAVGPWRQKEGYISQDLLGTIRSEMRQKTEVEISQECGPAQ